MGNEAVFLEKNRERILACFGEAMSPVPETAAQVEKLLEKCDPETALACRYLYAFMPCSDMANYPCETFLDFASHGVKLWREKPEVRALPEEIFLNYVLFHRVNEEEIRPCRSLFYDCLRERTKGLFGEEAALEVNYWCAGEVTYHSTDDRTLSALAIYRRGSGRCGEESVFTVNAMRSIGLPARQVYAPKWSHCDDNHAWVEVWCDGKWYFTGACEPQPVLNNGWFTNAASRAMMVHSRCFDKMDFEGGAAGREGMVTMQNQLGRYARTKEISVLVQDCEGRPVPGAEVSFEVLNYSEYASVAKLCTGPDGRVRLVTGLGSLHIQAVYEGLVSEGVIDTRSEEECAVILRREFPEDIWREVDMAAPVDTPVNTIVPSPQQKEAARPRLEQAAEKLRQKQEKWVNPEREAFLAADGTKTAATGETAAAGRTEAGAGEAAAAGRTEAGAGAGEAAAADMTVSGTAGGTAADAKGLRARLLEVLTDKDQTDCVREVLEEHLAYALPYLGAAEQDIFVSCVLNPRVGDEVLRKYRRAVLDTFSQEEQERFRNAPEALWEAVDKRIISMPERERSSVITTPAGCLKTGIGSPLSKRILFVAAARTLGIPARLNPGDGAMEYWRDGAFVPVLEEARKSCRLTLEDGGHSAWKYFQNWSIARLAEGKYVSLKLTRQEWEDGRLSLQLEPGRYRILTSNRLPNGNIFAGQYELLLKAGEEKRVRMFFRQAELSDMLENISIPEFYLSREDGTPVPASELTGEGKHILMFLKEGEEPTEHILNEMLEQKKAYASLAERIIFILQSPGAKAEQTLSGVLGQLPGIRICYDDFTETVNMLGRRMYVDHEKLPLILVTDGSLNGIYAASGYNVGTGDMLLRLM